MLFSNASMVYFDSKNRCIMLGGKPAICGFPLYRFISYDPRWQVLFRRTGDKGIDSFI